MAQNQEGQSDGTLILNDVDHYTYHVWWSGVDASFMVDVVELDGVLAFGETPEDALRSARDVARVWVEDAAASGEAVPTPQGYAAWVARELAVLTGDPVTADDVRVIRCSLGLTQRAFADLLGVALNTVRAWEQGINEPNGASQHLIRLIDTLAHASNVPPRTQEAISMGS